VIIDRFGAVWVGDIRPFTIILKGIGEAFWKLELGDFISLVGEEDFSLIGKDVFNEFFPFPPISGSRMIGRGNVVDVTDVSIFVC